MRKPDTDQRDKDMGKADAEFIGRREVFRLVGSVCAIGGLAAVVSCDSRQDMAHDGASTTQLRHAISRQPTSPC